MTMNPQLLDDSNPATRKKLDTLITQMEPIHVTVFRTHYGLPYGSPILDNLTDLEILVDNRRWKYIHGEVDKDGEPIKIIIEEEEYRNPFDWEDVEGIEADDGEDEEDDDDWLPDGPEFTLSQNAINKMIARGELNVDEKARKAALAQAANDELEGLLRATGRREN